MCDHHNPPSDEKSWDEFYRSHDALWSGNANPQLVKEISTLPPRTALDAGCGEGGDAIWLAQKGWQVTGMDFAETALRRAADNATRADPELATRITWMQADLTAWQPSRRFDLVTSHFMHLPTKLREPVFTALAAAVAPGGTLLIVGHHPSDMQAAIGRPDLPDWYFTAEDIADALDPNQWNVVVAESRNRTFTRDDEEFDIADTVLRAERKPAGEST
ncbi:class I SAM-dependent methyltransferase [Mycobacteroides salmoniphilum]|uniref:Tellurite resistance protein TehB n=1 Tax=Mycobacteroides salmoniphilum TaxID=404941 RepID=A0A4R8SQH6_9MYCO|nr:class I SAM-dependent methyltransferase [Mycobacteroides salmoniphilum]QCH24702.1 Trans-aconitate 2-methyltransferase [Mycobacteroides salmoniphilum]TDZ91412.1 tellurite resistance protein TehB [Mycobacteroides salmoniphilum]TEA01289.1 tellurite resistance protein TehB [Mycobacteroides salmoniphilum]